MIKESIIIIGYLARNAEYHTFEDKTGFLSFTVGAKAKKDAETVWFDCVKTGSQALKQYLIKGTKVLIVGIPYIKERRDKMLNLVEQRCIRVQDIELLKAGSGATIAQGVAVEESGVTVEKYDLPY